MPATKKTAAKKTRTSHPTIKLPRNGGPLICYKHDVMMDMVRRRRKMFLELPVGFCYYTSGIGFEAPPEDKHVVNTKNDVWDVFSRRPANLFAALLVLLKSVKRDGKRMEAGLKERNKRIQKLEAENKRMRDELETANARGDALKKKNELLQRRIDDHVESNN